MFQGLDRLTRAVLLPPDSPVPNYADSPPGSLSNHLSASEIQDLFQPNRNLTADEIIQKADLIRSGRVPRKAALGDPRLLRVLDETFGIKMIRPNVTDGGTVIEPDSEVNP